MTRFHGGVFVLPALLLTLSWLGSYFLFAQGRKFYLQTNAIRLDPLGRKVHLVAVPRGDEPIVVFFGDSRAAEWSPRLKSRSSSSGIWGSKKRCHSCLASFFRRIRLRKKVDYRMFHTEIFDPLLNEKATLFNASAKRSKDRI